MAQWVKNLPAVQETGDAGWIPGPGRSPGGGNSYPRQHSCLEKPMDRGAWWTTVHKVAKRWTWLSTHACKSEAIHRLSSLWFGLVALQPVINSSAVLLLAVTHTSSKKKKKISLRLLQFSCFVLCSQVWKTCTHSKSMHGREGRFVGFYRLDSTTSSTLICL